MTLDRIHFLAFWLAAAGQLSITCDHFRRLSISCDHFLAGIVGFILAKVIESLLALGAMRA